MNTKQEKLIFIIDDDPFWTDLLTFLLDELGYGNVKSFPSGAEGMLNLDMNPDIIFLDYEMEEMDGLKVLQKIKNSSAQADVVFATSKEDLEVAMDAIKLGSREYLLKQNASMADLGKVLNMPSSNNN